MATLFDTVTDKTKVWRGASRVLIAATGTSFPGLLESVIQPKTPQPNSHKVGYAVTSPWTDIGGTTEDGVTLSREFEAQDGVVVDQLKYALFEGDPKTWKMTAGFTMLHTDYPSLAIAWELPSAATIAANTAGPDYAVAQHRAKFSAPDTLTDRLLAVVQQHPTSESLRVFVFRSAKLAGEASELAVKGSEASGLAVSLNLFADTTVDNDQDPFGEMFEED